ncbi:MAG: MFS transporter [Bosea sp. (in: a-proteobacteria)]
MTTQSVPPAMPLPDAGASNTVAKRNVRILTVAQALGGATPPIIVSLGGVIGMQLADDKALATLPVSLLNIGLACAVIPAAWLMRRYGRRIGYIIGCLAGVISGIVAAAGTARGAFWLFCLGTFLSGFYIAFVQSYRFAAIDSASESYKARAISLVMVGGLFAAVIGPQTVIWTRELTPLYPFAASFLALSGLALMAMLVVSLLNAPAPKKQVSGGRPLGEIMRQPRFITAVICGLMSYGLMTFLMTAAPMAMVACGHSIGEAALGIQWHVLAMFAPSFFTGDLINRFGKDRITAAGLVMIAVAAVVALSGLTVAHFWISLILLGVGWNFGFVGATSMVTDCYRPEERNKVQAANDFLVFGAVAMASLSSGKLLHIGGWDIVNWVVFPAVGVALLMVVIQARSRPVLAV